MAEACVIVGYGPGVGAAVARAFAARGATLALIARDTRKLAAAEAELAASGYEAKGFPADAGDENSLTAALAAASDAFGDPGVLVYNAAHWRPGPTLALARADLVRDFETCVAGALTAASAVVPAMQARGSGAILFTGGGLALYPSPEAPSLSIGKAGIRALASMLAQELAASGVRVGTVTIAGTVGPELTPERVAQAFLALHDGVPDPATAEIVLRR